VRCVTAETVLKLGVPHQLAPSLALNVWRDLHHLAGRGQRLVDRREALLVEPWPRADRDSRRRLMAHDTRLIDGGAHIHRCGKNPAWTEARRQLLVGLDAVLQRDEHRGVADGGSQVVQDRFGLMRLDADQHEVGRPAFGCLRADRHARDVDVTENRGLDAQSASPHGLELCAPRHEMHVAAGSYQQGSEERADASGAIDQDSHGTYSVGEIAPRRYRSLSSGL
jgi:hypothetical protein